jgi:hypothetical protein
VLEKRYGFDHLNVYYFITKEGLEVDEEDFKAKLEDNKLFPANCFILLNLEGTPWSVMDSSMRPVQAAIDARCKRYEMAKTLRPDCQMAFYAQPACTRYEEVVNHTQQWMRLLESTRVLAEMQDYLVPSLYMRNGVYDARWASISELTPQRVSHWVTTAMSSLALMFPQTPIRPIVWPQWYSWPGWKAGAGDYGYAWTPEEQINCRLNSEHWQALLDAIKGHCDSLIIWGQGHCPWDATAEWFRATLKIANTKTN